MVKVKLESIREIGQLLEVMDWCETQFGPSKQDKLHRWVGGRWCLDKDLYWTFKFVSSEDAVLFKLRWA
jgi:hypothetical protein